MKLPAFLLVMILALSALLSSQSPKQTNEQVRQTVLPSWSHRCRVLMAQRFFEKANP